MEEDNLTALKSQQEKYEQILSLRNQEVTDFVDKVIKENCALKRQIVLNEIDLSKYQEMLTNMSVKYYNLDTGNMNETERIYYDSIHSIKEDNEKKLNEINEKYKKANDSLYKEHMGIIYNLKKMSKKAKEFDSINDKEIEAAFVTEDIPVYTLITIRDKVDSFETKLKTINEELYNSQKYAQMIQQKYEALLQENKMIKARLIEEKNSILFTIEQISKKDTESIQTITNEYKTQSELITKSFLAFNNNEKNKEELLMKSLLSEKDELSTKVIVLNNKYNKIKEEYDSVLATNKKYESTLSRNDIEIKQLQTSNNENERNRKQYEDELKKMSIEAINNKQIITDLNTKLSSYENKMSLISNNIESEISKITIKYKEMIDELNKSLLQAEKEKRDMRNTYDKNTKSATRTEAKLKESNESNEYLNRMNQDLQNKLNESEMKNKMLTTQYAELEEHFKKFQSKFDKIDEQLTLTDDQVFSTKKKFAENEVEIVNLKDELSKMEQSKTQLQKSFDEAKRENLLLTQKYEGLKTSTNNEILKLKSQLNERNASKSSLNANIASNELSQYKKSINKVYQIYQGIFKHESGVSQFEEMKMLLELEANLEQAATSYINNEIRKITDILNKKDKEIEAYKTKMNKVFQLTSNAKSNNKQTSIASNASLIVKNLEDNGQLNQLYEHLIIHIKNNNLLHLLDLFKLNWEREEELFKVLQERNVISYNPQSKLYELQHQLDSIKQNATEVFKELNMRSRNYVSIQDYEKLFKDYQKCVQELVQMIIKTYLEYKTEQTATTITFQFPINQYNDMMNRIAMFINSEIGKSEQVLTNYLSQGEKIDRAVEMIYKMTSMDKEMISDILKDKL